MQVTHFLFPRSTCTWHVIKDQFLKERVLVAKFIFLG
jgi:hypothetical protein